MFAVVQIGSTQYIVHEKDEILVGRLDLAEGKNLMIDEVLLIGEDDGTKVQVGTPFLANVKVETRVMGEEKGEKIRIFKKKPKKRYERTQGYRSVYTRLKVLKVSVLNGSAPAEIGEEAPVKEVKAKVAKAPAVKKTAVKKTAAKKKAA